MTNVGDNRLGTFLRDRRAKVDPARLGLPLVRRRIPGLRREEVALRAEVSVTWYTFLEQGRGGRPSADVLDRLAVALTLTDAERQHLFLLAQNRLPEAEVAQVERVSATTQRLLDTLDGSPSYVRTPAWDVIAWNAAAAAVFGDDPAAPAAERNLLRRHFLRRSVRDHTTQWAEIAASLVASFRADMTRSGAAREAAIVAADLAERSPEFRALWERLDVEVASEPRKQVSLPDLGTVSFEVSTLRLDGPGDLTMVVFNPVSSADRALVRQAVDLTRC